MEKKKKRRLNEQICTFGENWQFTVLGHTRLEKKKRGAKQKMYDETHDSKVTNRNEGKIFYDY